MAKPKKFYTVQLTVEFPTEYPTEEKARKAAEIACHSIRVNYRRSEPHIEVNIWETEKWG